MAAKWIESSVREKDLTIAAYNILFSDSLNDHDSCQRLEQLAMYLYYRKLDLTYSIEIGRRIEKFICDYPEISEIDFGTGFPKIESDLTGNFFNRLAYHLTTKVNNPIDSGLVGTPGLLAIDMVRLASFFWLSDKNPFSTERLKNIIFGLEKGAVEEIVYISERLRAVKWYDPCVGGGAFTVAVAVLLQSFGINLDRLVLLNIIGSELNPVLATAARLRLSFFACANNAGDLRSIYGDVCHTITTGDSLASFTEQGLLILGNYGLEKADIVIGNPPYIRSGRIPDETKKHLKSRYPSVAGGAVDLYNYFIAHGLIALNTGGILCYVSPASFQKSNYGEKTRQFIAKQGSLRALFDFNELPVFDGASIHPSVYAIERGAKQKEFITSKFDDLPENNPLLFGLNNSKVMPARNADNKSWYFHIEDIENLVGYLSKNSTPLLNYVGAIYSGIKPGTKKAFFIPKKEAEELLFDEGSKPFIQPLLMPVTIERWRPNWNGTYIALIKRGEIVPLSSALMKRLLNFENMLRSRSDVKGHPTWYGLRHCGYYEVFSRPKIVFPDISTKCRFAMDTQGFFVAEGSFIIPKEDYYLLGLLNSCVGRFYFRNFCNSIGNPYNGGRLRFKKVYVQQFPVAIPSDEDMATMEKIAILAQELSQGIVKDNAANQIDRLALEIYHVPKRYWSRFEEQE